MDEIESGNAASVTSEEVGAIGRRRTRVLVAVGAGVLVVGGLMAVLAGCDSGSSGNHAGGATDTTVGGTGRSGTQAGDSRTTVKGSGPHDTGSSVSGPGNSSPGSTTRGSTSGPGVTFTGGSKVPRNSTGTTRPLPPGVTIQPPNTAPPDSVAPSIALAYTAGYQGECRHIWASTADADGLLWDPDWLELGGDHVDVCFKQEIPSYAGFYSSPAEAQQNGVADADSDMSDYTVSGTLINTSRTKTWTGGG